MKALLYKEIASLKMELFVSVLCAVLFFLISLNSGNGIFEMVLFVFAVMLLINGLSVDEKSKVLKFIFLTDIERKQWVVSKYLIFGMYMFFSLIVVFLSSVILADYHLFFTALIVIFAMIAVVGVAIPVCIKFGVKYAIIPFVLLYIIGIFTSTNFTKDIITNLRKFVLLTDNYIYTLIILFSFSVILIALSLTVSLKIIKNKDL